MKSKMLAFVVLTLALAACGGAEVASDEPTTTQAPVTTAAPDTTVTTQAPTTTTTEAPTTTEATIGEATTPLQAVALFTLAFGQMRQPIIDIWSDDINVETVDLVNLDVPDTGDPDTDLLSTKVVVDVTSGWASEDNQHDGAWEMTRAMAVLWASMPAGDEGVFYGPQWVPAFRLVNSGRVYECPGEFMTQLGDTLAARSDWETTCVQ